MSSAIAEYRKALVADESPASLDRALDLAEQVASGDNRKTAKWVDVLTGTPRPAPMSKAGGTRSRDSRQARDVMWALSTLPEKMEKFDMPESQYSLLTDIFLLVLHQAYFSLLPKADAERDSLLRVFLQFSEKVPCEADQFRIKGLVRLAQEDFDGSLKDFRAAVALTSSEEEVFLTRVQTFWSLLMERDRHSEAFEFLSDISSRVTRDDFGEFKELQRITFDVASRR